jgi:hypothetical protein
VEGSGEVFCSEKEVASRGLLRSYPEPLDGGPSLAGMVCFYPGRVRCLTDEERVRAQSWRFLRRVDYERSLRALELRMVSDWVVIGLYISRSIF